ncbi:MAG: flagellar basal body rod protein FlgB [Syntrophaceticus sp.]|nr:flagellar basal body rod protein FlgB [Syntrophaceticus sp.]MDD4360676.1 flagellar basal body rod protein FlgB [Syntrophaceticus sp.]MDD4783285.1 flagellar basal body rod protein FlgB [Syntrophaceticus sp.]
MLFNSITGVMERALDLNWIRQQLISNNIANVDTPNYKRMDIDFKSSLFKALDEQSVTQAGTDAVKPEFVVSDDLTHNNDGNSVDIEKEMAEQAVNSLQYALLTRLVSDQLGMLKTAISEGRR